MDVEVGGVDDHVGGLSQLRKQRPFGGDRLDEASFAQRVRSAVLLVTAHEIPILGVKEQNAGVDPLPVELIDGGQQRFHRLAHPAVDHDRQTPSPLRHIVMRDRLGDELRRKVVDHREAEILKYLGGRGAAGPRHAGHDQDFRSRLNLGGLVLFDYLNPAAQSTARRQPHRGALP